MRNALWLPGKLLEASVCSAPACYSVDPSVASTSVLQVPRSLAPKLPVELVGPCLPPPTQVHSPFPIHPNLWQPH